MSPTTVALVVLGVLLALSTAGNAYFWHERDGLLQREATVQQLTIRRLLEGLAVVGIAPRAVVRDNDDHDRELCECLECENERAAEETHHVDVEAAPT